MLNVDTSFVRFRYPSATLPPGSWAKILFPSALITPHSVRQRKGQLVRPGIAQADRQAALRVSVDQQDFLSGLRQPDSQVGTGRCLANAAFLVGNGNDLRVHDFTSFLIVTVVSGNRKSHHFKIIK